jgi:hypothetical protein
LSRLHHAVLHQHREALHALAHAVGGEVAQRLDRLRDGGALLPDGDVDALHALTLLVQDRVDRNGRLAGLAVTDDELALTPADGGHGVDGLDTGLQGLADRLTLHDGRRLQVADPAGAVKTNRQTMRGYGA